MTATRTDKAVARLDKSKPLLIYCHSGMRSADAAKRLTRAGFTRVYNLKGGVLGWQQADLPISKGK